jgi:hypothetical protein
VHQLFAGTCQPEAVITQYGDAGRRERFYSASMWGSISRQSAIRNAPAITSAWRPSCESQRTIWDGWPSCTSASAAGLKTELTRPEAAPGRDRAHVSNPCCGGPTQAGRLAARPGLMRCPVGRQPP